MTHFLLQKDDGPLSVFVGGGNTPLCGTWNSTPGFRELLPCSWAPVNMGEGGVGKKGRARACLLPLN
ncbi:hypothetical protein [Endozoicomonas sp. 8E]|uniref:hypothetical protein n=1 Tax=Endozoicomonas sp. 8E TaxID=3035692 RepID=UPI0029391BC0|nr:hypothetical protein [Endozoicomonas sp. 8E]WOG30476.1 hypothetical protein P6910_06855 [Endozoicomonas sp. 8E]